MLNQEAYGKLSDVLHIVLIEEVEDFVLHKSLKAFNDSPVRCEMVPLNWQRAARSLDCCKWQNALGELLLVARILHCTSRYPGNQAIPGV